MNRSQLEHVIRASSAITLETMPLPAEQRQQIRRFLAGLGAAR